MKIDPKFWANFDDDFIDEMTNPKNPLERRRLYADRQTYENWLSGDFVVWHGGGRQESVHGVMFNREDMEREFPPGAAESERSR